MMSVLTRRTVLVLALALAAGVAQARELKPYTTASLDAIRAQHAGRPFVLAFWSIYCEPCREEMAEWKALRRRHPGVPVVLVSTDLPAERAAVTAFLARFDPGDVDTWMFADEFTERLRYSVDRSWRGELPRTYLYDAGHRPLAKSGRFDRRWIGEWLARQSPARSPRSH